VTESANLSPSHSAQADDIVRQLRKRGRRHSGGAPAGTDSGSKRAIARRVAVDLQLEVYSLSADTLPTVWAELEALARLWQRESQLLPIALYLDAQDADHLPAVTRYLAWVPGLVFLDTRDAWPLAGRDTVTVDVAPPASRRHCSPASSS
jgi:hypothetical protein